MKICTRCPENGLQPITNFPKKGNRYASWCKACTRAYHQNHYQSNRDYHSNRKLARRNKIREWIKAHKTTLKCSRCPEDHPSTLHFHHRDPHSKEITLAIAARSGWSISRIQKEITKCDILCANCHSKEHWDD